MNDEPNGLAQDWLAEELADVLDEDFELELEDAALSREIARIYLARPPDAMDSRATIRARRARKGVGCILARTADPDAA